MKNHIRIAAKVAPMMIAALAIALSDRQVAQASSDNAWAEFAKDVEKACLKTSAASIANGRAVVDPYGSAKYGLAIVTGRPAGVPKTKKLADISVICVYDKKTKAAEIGGEIEISKLAMPSSRRP